MKHLLSTVVLVHCILYCVNLQLTLKGVERWIEHSSYG